MQHGQSSSCRRRYRPACVAHSMSNAVLHDDAFHIAYYKNFGLSYDNSVSAIQKGVHLSSRLRIVLLESHGLRS